MDVVLARHTGRETRWGLRLASWALLMQLVAILWGAAFAVVLRVIFLQELDFSAYSFYLFFLGLPATLLSLASALTFLLGFSAMYRHRGEPGNARHEDMRKSFLLLLAVIVAFVARWGVILFLPAFFPTALDPEEFQTLQTVRSVVSGSVGIIVNVLLALFFYYVVVSLVPANLVSRLKLAVVLLVLGAIVTFALVLASPQIGLPLQEFNEVLVAPPGTGSAPVLVGVSCFSTIPEPRAP